LTLFKVLNCVINCFKLGIGVVWWNIVALVLRFVKIRSTVSVRGFSLMIFVIISGIFFNIVLSIPWVSGGCFSYYSHAIFLIAYLIVWNKSAITAIAFESCPWTRGPSLWREITRSLWVILIEQVPLMFLIPLYFGWRCNSLNIAAWDDWW
jgi:hypothetical protein